LQETNKSFEMLSRESSKFRDSWDNIFKSKSRNNFNLIQEN